MAPEYASRGQLTEKADVFSFGVVALEIVSGRRCIEPKFAAEDIYLIELVRAGPYKSECKLGKCAGLVQTSCWSYANVVYGIAGLEITRPRDASGDGRPDDENERLRGGSRAGAPRRTVVCALG